MFSLILAVALLLINRVRFLLEVQVISIQSANFHATAQTDAFLTILLQYLALFHQLATRFGVVKIADCYDRIFWSDWTHGVVLSLMPL